MAEILTELAAPEEMKARFRDEKVWGHMVRVILFVDGRNSDWAGCARGSESSLSWRKGMGAYGASNYSSTGSLHSHNLRYACTEPAHIAQKCSVDFMYKVQWSVQGAVSGTKCNVTTRKHKSVRSTHTLVQVSYHKEVFITVNSMFFLLMLVAWEVCLIEKIGFHHNDRHQCKRVLSMTFGCWRWSWWVHQASTYLERGEDCPFELSW